MHLLFLILDIGVNQQRVGHTVYVLHSYLKAIEAPGLWRCDLGREVPAKLLVDYFCFVRFFGIFIFVVLAFLTA